MSGQFHAPAALLSGKKTTYPLKKLLWVSRILSGRYKQKKCCRTTSCPLCMRTSLALLKICEKQLLVSLCLRPSAWNYSILNGRIFAKFYTGIFTKVCWPYQVWLKSYKNWKNFTKYVSALMLFFTMDTDCFLRDRRNTWRTKNNN